MGEPQSWGQTLAAHPVNTSDYYTVRLLLPTQALPDPLAAGAGDSEVGEEQPPTPIHTSRLGGKLRPRRESHEEKEGGKEGQTAWVGRGHSIKDSVNDFCSPSLSEGQSPRAAANQWPAGLLPSSLCCQGPPSSVSPWESGSGGQVPGRRPFCPEPPVFPPNILLGPA